MLPVFWIKATGSATHVMGESRYRCSTAQWKGLHVVSVLEQTLRPVIWPVMNDETMLIPTKMAEAVTENHAASILSITMEHPAMNLENVHRTEDPCGDAILREVAHLCLP